MHGADEAGVRVRSVGAKMSAEIYRIWDYERKEHKLVKRPQTLEEMAKDITSQLSGLIGEEVACEMVPYHGAGIDGIWPDKDPA